VLVEVPVMLSLVAMVNRWRPVHNPSSLPAESTT
jgi:ACR3 family arsenite efflux pump ArsB